MANILLTNSTYIKSLTNISDNVQDKYLFTSINEAQEIDLKSVLGDVLLEKVKTLVKEGHINEEEYAIYKTLLEKCQFFIAYTVVAKLAVITSFKIDNAGLYRSNDDNMTYASLKEVQNLQEYYQNKADFFKLELQNFILNNSSKLPEVSKCHIHSIHANLYSAESCGLVLGGSRGKHTINNRHHIIHIHR